MLQGGCGKEFCSKKRTFTLNCVIPCWTFIPTQYKLSFLYICGVLTQQYFIVKMIWTTQLICYPHDHFSFCQEWFGLCFQISRWSNKRDEEVTLEEELTGAEWRRQHAFLWHLIFALVCSQTDVEGTHPLQNTISLGKHCPVCGMSFGSRTEVCFSLGHIGFSHSRV